MRTSFDFRSADARFGLVVPAGEMNRIRTFAGKAGRRETGGILVGHYATSLDHAYVTEASAPPKDSAAGGWTFERGLQGLAGWLERLWKAPKRTYYLGEWHYHPFASPEASPTDRAQMAEIARTPRYRCSEPVLLILGGDPKGIWDVRAYVFPAGSEHVALDSAAGL